MSRILSVVQQSLPQILPGLPLHVALGTATVLFVFLLLLRTPLGRRTLDMPLRLMLLAGLLIFACHIGQTDFRFQENDVRGHFEYFRYLYQHKMLPGSMDGWQFYQPPLYYLLAMPFYALGMAFHRHEEMPLEAVRFFSLCNYLVLLLYSVALFRLFTGQRWLVWLATGLLVLWPTSVVYAGKVNNDVLIYSLSIMSLYYLVRWCRLSRPEDLWAAVLVAALSVGVKSSGVMMGAVIVACVALRWWRHGLPLAAVRADKRWIALTLAVAVACAGLNFGRTMYTRLARATAQDFVVGNQTNRDPKEQKDYIENDDWPNYVLFDPVAFVTRPCFINTDYQRHTDRLFWNALFRNALVGKKTWVEPRLEMILSTLFVALLAFVVTSASWAAWRSPSRRRLLIPPFLLAAVSCLGLLYLRANYHFQGFTSARYIHYIVPLFLVGFVVALSWHRQRKQYVWLGVGVSLALLLAVGFVVHLFNHLMA